MDKKNAANDAVVNNPSSASLQGATRRRFDTIPACDRRTDRQTEMP